jgi:RNA polymerase sigma factor (sigma-70 family)
LDSTEQERNDESDDARWQRCVATWPEGVAEADEGVLRIGLRKAGRRKFRDDEVRLMIVEAIIHAWQSVVQTAARHLFVRGGSGYHEALHVEATQITLWKLSDMLRNPDADVVSIRKQLVTIAVHDAIDLLRKEARHQERRAAAGTGTEDYGFARKEGPGPTTRELMQQIREKLAQLDPLIRQIVECDFEHDLTNKEIAARFGISLDRVKHGKSAGMKLLMEWMRDAK